jgi:hypothetical protein
LRALRCELAAMKGSLRWRMVERLFRGQLGYDLGHRRAVKVLRVVEGRTIKQELPGNVTCRLTGGGLELIKGI